MRYRTVLATFVALILAAPAWARDGDDLQARLEDANARLTELDTHEFSDDAAVELGQARLEVAEIQGKIAADDLGDAIIVMARLEARLDLIASALERATVEDLADQRESDLIAMQAEADELQLQLEAAQQRRQQLQDEVGLIVDRMNAEGDQ